MEYREHKKHFSKLGWYYTGGALLIALLQTLAALIAKAINPEWLDNMNISIMLSVVPMYLIAMPLMVFAVSKLPGKAPEKHRMMAWQFVLALIMCYAIMYTSNILGTIFTTFIGLVKGTPVTNELMDVIGGTSLITNFIYMVICAPILEELIFRKLIVDKTRRYGEGVAIVLSGVMFGLFHGNLSQFMYAFTLGMFFAFIYTRTGNIKITIWMHAIVNFMGSILAVLLLDAIDYETLMEISNSEVYDPNAVMNLVMDNMLGWVLYMGYIVLLLGLTVAGIVLLIVFRKKFVLYPGEIVLEKGKRFSTVFLNSGMIAFALYWGATIVVQLFLS